MRPSWWRTEGWLSCTAYLRCWKCIQLGTACRFECWSRRNWEECMTRTNCCWRRVCLWGKWPACCRSWAQCRWNCWALPSCCSSVWSLSWCSCARWGRTYTQPDTPSTDWYRSCRNWAGSNPSTCWSHYWSTGVRWGMRLCVRTAGHTWGEYRSSSVNQATLLSCILVAGTCYRCICIVPSWTLGPRGTESSLMFGC